MFSDNVFCITTEEIELWIDMNDLEVNNLATDWLIGEECTGKAGGYYYER